MWRCARCPRFMGCFPECEFPSASWVSNKSNSDQPEWAKQWDAEMDKQAALAHEQGGGNNG